MFPESLLEAAALEEIEKKYRNAEQDEIQEKQEHIVMIVGARQGEVVENEADNEPDRGDPALVLLVRIPDFPDYHSSTLSRFRSGILGTKKARQNAKLFDLPAPNLWKQDRKSGKRIVFVSDGIQKIRRADVFLRKRENLFRINHHDGTLASVDDVDEDTGTCDAHSPSNIGKEL